MPESALSLHYVSLGASGFAHHAVWLILETWVNHCLLPFAERSCMGWGLPSIPACIKVSQRWVIHAISSLPWACTVTLQIPRNLQVSKFPMAFTSTWFLSSSSSPAAVSILGKCHTHSWSKLWNNIALVLGPSLMSKLWVKSNKVRP